MSYDRVLPNPASLRYESAPVSTLPRPSDLLDHKIMNDHLPKSYMALPHRPGPGGMSPVAENARYTSSASEMRPNGVAQTHRHLASYGRARGSIKIESAMSPMQQHVKPGPMISTKDLARDRSASSSGSSSPTKSAKSEAFILYRQHWQSLVVERNPGMANPEISKVIGEQWRQLSEEDKSEWKALAEEEKARHAQQYPDYRYQPRRVGRDGSSRNNAGISHNPNGGSTCNRCHGRIMNAPSTPMTPFTPMVSQGHRGSFSGPPSSRPHVVTTTVMTASSSQCRKKADRAPKPIRIDQIERPRHRKMEEEEEEEVMSPEIKRRRLSYTSLKPPMHAHRDRSPESPYPMTPYSAPANVHQSRSMLPMMHSQPGYEGAPVQSQSQPQPQGQTIAVPDPSLKLPPLQTAIPSTPLTPLSTADSSVEAAVMTIPFLNKIKLLSKISPPLVPSFRENASRGPVIAVDGQDPDLVRTAVEYLQRLLQKEDKFSVRVFKGPDVQAPRSSDGGPMGDATVDYLNTISAWHRISDDIIGFVKSVSTSQSPGTDTPSNTHTNTEPTTDQDRTRSRTTPDGSASPRAIIPKTATLNIHSPESTSADSETSIKTPNTTKSTLSHTPAPPSTSPNPTRTPTPTPVALVPRYQLTTADTFACNIPINDSYAPLDHWQWMASLWRACVGPDITVYVRECSREEVERVGAVEIRLEDFRTVVLRKAFGTGGNGVGGGVEEKVLRRMGFEIEDYLTQ
ncbi:Repressor of filamentous growth 1 [Penicillium subrubescens]|uniref:Repressor of filamentous growth 1 n=1 Tax=Penicillium subrubescens TaxID=1316194 RepID=A0A1Q5UNG1_9EURO|nr:Repressor of filamentous growth 1 [Penicillium subrubescens]